MMMKKRAQGAMEYLMTYGWAILVVMIVGMVMWRLDIFNIGGSTPPTAKGFGVIKPLLSSCKIDMENEYAASFIGEKFKHGFSCQFANAAGTVVRIRDVNMSVNDKPCGFAIVDKVPIFDMGKSIVVYSVYNHLPDWDKMDICFDSTTQPPCDYTGTGKWLPIDAGGVMTAAVFSDVGGCKSYDPCCNLKPDETYKVYVDITYGITIDDKNLTRHSTGEIRLQATV